MVIWLDRNPIDQAISQAKFATLIGGLPMISRTSMRKWTTNLRRDRLLALERLPAVPRLMLSFEEIIAAPLTCAQSLTRFLMPSFGDIDTRSMAASVIERSPQCADGLDIEIMLIRKAEGRA